MRRHGQRRGSKDTLTYTSWRAMRQRLTNPNHRAFPWYGGAGLTCDARWVDFVLFFEDMGRRPRREYTLDRIDPTKGYYKENCRWATPAQQQANRCKKYEDMNPEEQAAYDDMCEAF